MPLIPYRPFWDLEKFFEDEWPERWRPAVPEFQAPKMDIYEDNGNVVAEAELPGIDPKNIDVEVRDNVLRVEAKSEEKKEEKKKGYYKKEMSRGFFRRSVLLPAEVIGNKADAAYQGGVLKIVIPKAKPKKEAKKGTKVKVKEKK